MKGRGRSGLERTRAAVPWSQLPAHLTTTAEEVGALTSPRRQCAWRLQAAGVTGFTLLELGAPVSL